MANPIVDLKSNLFLIYQAYESLVYDQMYKFFDQIFFRFQCGFFNGFNTQNCLIYDRKLEEKTALLTDLSKTFDCIMHNLLIAKLQAYGFDSNSLTFS